MSQEPECRWDHARFKTASQWPLLPYVGEMPSETEDGKPSRLELRNCVACNSTLAVEVVP
jgi:hypothetical protein